MNTRLPDIQDQVQNFFSPIFQDQLTEDTLLYNLVNKEYETDLTRPLKGGDIVRVSQINRPTVTRNTIGVDSDSFNTSKIATQKVDLKLTDRTTAAYALEDLTELLSQLKDQNSKIRQTLFESVDIDLNDFLYEKVNTLGFTNITTSASADIALLQDLRKQAAQRRWRKDEWWLLLDPNYYTELLGVFNLTTSDSGAQDAPVIGGRFGMKRFGFNIVEDNSDGILLLQKVAGTKAGLAFHRDFLLAAASQPQFKLSDKHSNNQHGFNLSVDMVEGAIAGNDGNDKVIIIREP